MAIATTLQDFLASRDVAYDVVTHPQTPSASRTAQAAHVTGEQVAKTVVLHDSDGYVLLVVPATHRIELDAVQSLLDRRLSLAAESEITGLFGDCEVGAVPPIGEAYGLEVLLDESLTGQPEIFFEGGDHRSLVHLEGARFETLMGNAQRGRFSHHV
jgi:Ala-tRNA(Pro) deacylase